MLKSYLILLLWPNSIADFSAEIKKYEKEYHRIEIPNEEHVFTYFKIRQQLAKLAQEIQEFTHKPKYCLPFLQPGRLVKVELHTTHSGLTTGRQSVAQTPQFTALRVDPSGEKQ